jgi:hypothetical protein
MPDILAAAAVSFNVGASEQPGRPGATCRARARCGLADRAHRA